MKVKKKIKLLSLLLANISLSYNNILNLEVFFYYKIENIFFFYYNLEIFSRWHDNC